MSLALFGHPFSSYTQKALIALYADGTEFESKELDVEKPEPFFEALEKHWPLRRFPLLVDNGRAVIESTCIIEYLQAHHRGPNEWIPDGEQGRRVRFLDRFFDLYVMNNMTKIVTDSLRPEGASDRYGVDQARGDLNLAYDWLESQLSDEWAAGEAFTLADCSAAPSLLYADWAERIGPSRPKLGAYRARLLEHPSVSRCVEEARPYRHFFPLGDPGRD